MLNYLLSALARLKSSLSGGPTWGHFEGNVDTTWLGNGRDMRLNADFHYIDPKGKLWIAPKGAIINGASIPRVFWSVMGGPFEGLYRNASVIHDVACDEERRPWRDVHRVFYDAMRCSGVSKPDADLMYFAVYHFGPRWLLKNPATLYGMGVDPNEVKEVTRQRTPPFEWDIDNTRDYLEQNQLSLTEIENMKVAP